MIVLYRCCTVRSSAGVSYISKCTGSCEPGSRCHPNECIFGREKPRGVGNLELGVYEQGERIGEFSLQAIGDQGGWILSQQGGFQVNERGVGKGSKGRQKGEKIKQGEYVMCTVICIRVYKCMLVVTE